MRYYIRCYVLLHSLLCVITFVVMCYYIRYLCVTTFVVVCYHIRYVLLHSLCYLVGKLLLVYVMYAAVRCGVG